MAVTEPNRLLDHARTDAPAQVPGAETDERDAGAVRCDDLHLRALTVLRTR
jgi:hypothetical protein